MKFGDFLEKHEDTVVFATVAILTGFVFGLSISIPYKKELGKVIKEINKLKIPQKTVKTYIVRVKDNPEEVFKIIKF